MYGICRLDPKHANKTSATSNHHSVYRYTPYTLHKNICFESILLCKSEDFTTVSSTAVDLGLMVFLKEKKCAVLKQLSNLARQKQIQNLWN